MDGAFGNLQAQKAGDRHAPFLAVAQPLRFSPQRRYSFCKFQVMSRQLRRLLQLHANHQHEVCVRNQWPHDSQNQGYRITPPTGDNASKLILSEMGLTGVVW